MEYDVIVCGGGTAGATAAIKACRLGAKTLVVEQMNGLGGTQSMGWVTPMMPNYLGDEQLVGGVNRDIQLEHAGLSPETNFPNAQVWYNPVILALALDRLADEAGVERLYGSFLVRAFMMNESITGIDVTAKGSPGLLRLTAKVFIDATGDADLAFLAGAPTDSGDETGTNQPMTLRFAVGNVDIGKVGSFFGDDARPNMPDFLSVGFADAKASVIGEAVKDAIETGMLAQDDIGYFQFFTMLGRPRELAFNCPRITGFDPLDAFSLSKAMSVGREKIFRIHAFCKAYLPGLEDSYVSVVAPLMGIRESRRIVGRYVLTEEDHQSCRKFPDAIARNRYPIDIHLASGGVDLKKLPPDDYHEIPYRCLLPVGVSNLLVAGRCLSATFAAQSSVRIQPVCRAMGEAAGAAAALCARDGVAPGDLAYSLLRGQLDFRVG
ncbi:MAG: FAD-dependent oxidoreductase [Fimbriimonadales bacterium]